jgi:hypothetical protein
MTADFHLGFVFRPAEGALKTSNRIKVTDPSPDDKVLAACGDK